MGASTQTQSEFASQGRDRPPEAANAPFELRTHAETLAQTLDWLPNVRCSNVLADRWRLLERKLNPILHLLHSRVGDKPVAEDLRWLHDNVNLLSSASQQTGEIFRSSGCMPHVQTPSEAVIPRVLAVSEGFLTAYEYQVSESGFAEYVAAFQRCASLNMSELWGMIPVIKLLLLEQIAARGAEVLVGAGGAQRVSTCVRSLQEMAQTPWKEVIEPLIPFEGILREDPAGAYSGMDFESRDFYRGELVNIAEHSDVSEREVAEAALELAQEASHKEYADARVRSRCSHIGYYLISMGRRALHDKVGFQPPFGQRMRSFLRQHPDDFYLLTFEVLTLSLMASALLLLTAPSTSPGFILFMMLVLLLPCSQGAVQLTNYFVTSLLQPRILPKLDFSEGIPANCITMVAIPSLLLSQKQVLKLVDDLEVRFLGNRDRNLHFALLTDLPDSPARPREDDALVDLCAQLIQQLNQKYAGEETGSFFLFHRHRIYNPRERMWMGWERKRGKLMDFNDLLRGQHDSFPVKIGDLSLLPKVRFVITLDADTKLPRGAAHRLIGTLAHPLNQAIIDREKNIVVAGYGIVQPRVGVSVHSSARSRLARIYSGQTGFDTYTCAVSDVYQDLYEEGSYAGKGIYEVDVLRQVLDGRFPHNALLSHDLIEGAYAGAGLASDIQVIEDYPSHYSAHNRRKHRWLRGDWQIVEWLCSTVPGQSGQRVRNPISTISKWKILDNLRRSLVEPATFVLLVLGWLIMPGSAWVWTLVTVAILFVPAWCRFMFEVARAAINRRPGIAREAAAGLFAANVGVFLALTFLAHQALLSLDAAIRATIRRILTRRHLLEWETAAQAECGATNRTPIEIYLDWTPLVAAALGVTLAVGRPRSLPAALPVLLLWGCSKLVSVWLNLPPRLPYRDLSQPGRTFVRAVALRTWRYFAQFSTEEHHWLIPDNVQEEPYRVASRTSPTNLGLLLNVRQAANRLGYLTVPEFVDLTIRTLASLKRLQRYRGHLLNWYDTRTLEPLTPRFVSSVDSGNLVASLWTLEQGCLDQLAQPLVERSLADGLLDCALALREQRVLPRPIFLALKKGLTSAHWLRYVLHLPDSTFDNLRRSRRANRNVDARWFIDQAVRRLNEINKAVRVYTPWLLPEFDVLRSDPVVSSLLEGNSIPLNRLPDHITRLEAHLQCEPETTETDSRLLSQRLLTLLPNARRDTVLLIQQLRQIACEAHELANQMDFSFLVHAKRKLLAVGFELEANQVAAACYDLLASEARLAAFVAIAKGDASQDLWFLLGRTHTVQQGRPILLSWSGTMFEYLMPSIWMRSQPDTLLANSQLAAVRVQCAYGRARGVPWGISESAHAMRDNDGNYQYFAFGIPALALAKPETNGPVISPYSTFLALHADTRLALQNLRKMARRGWLGRFGFYEAADFSPPCRSWRRDCEVVRCWMAHHQSMSLLSVANLLCDGVMQRWFHQDPRVQATELLLEEKPMAYVRPPLEKYGTNAA